MSLTLSDVSELLCKMTIKSCPLDPVPASVLKQCTSVLLPVMTQIVNLSLNLAALPDSFKLALFTLNPLLKKSTLDVEVFSPLCEHSWRAVCHAFAVVRRTTGFRAWTDFISALYLPIGGYCQAIQHGLSFLC